MPTFVFIYHDVVDSTLLTWGSIAAIVAGSSGTITALIAGAKAIYRWSLKNKPLTNVTCWLQPFDPENPQHPDIQHATNDVLVRFVKDNPNHSTSIKSNSGKYHLYLALTPRLPLELAEVNARLLGPDSAPRILAFYDANRRPTREYGTESDGVGGINLAYAPIMNAFKGKDIYYMVTFEAAAKWRGKLSLRFYFVGKEACSTRIPIDIQ